MTLHSGQHRAVVKAYTPHIRQLLDENPTHAPYFVTMTFSEIEVKARQPLKMKVEYVRRHYDRCYRHLGTILIKNNFPKKRHLHPRTFDFVDLPNTRYSFAINTCEPSTPHTHSIYLMPQELLERFEVLRSDCFKKLIEHHSFRGRVLSIHAVPVDADALHTVIDYSSKLMGKSAATPLSGEVDLFWQYPITKEEQQTRRDDLRFKRMLKRQALDNLKETYLSQSSGDAQLSRWTINICETGKRNIR